MAVGVGNDIYNFTESLQGVVSTRYLGFHVGARGFVTSCKQFIKLYMHDTTICIKAKRRIDCKNVRKCGLYLKIEMMLKICFSAT